jgi:hypothetical protein
MIGQDHELRLKVPHIRVPSVLAEAEARRGQLSNSVTEFVLASAGFTILKGAMKSAKSP